ncbi:MAG: D-beta-D-heptose 1-phosphate adenosyltransferase [Bacteroidetes bacterium]|nr:D-beta-D-heptose 1-phosphate adenosyltransferase [Bacteroidota bacterium]
MKLHPDISYKIIDLATLESRLHHWRAVGNRIVFTNGCFDILHRGHVELLAECRSYGDYVIVGLNADASVHKLKGEGRPINDQLSRASVLASLSFVDAVIIFDQDTPLELITFIRPDILVKGGDYKVEEIVGANVVRANGGEVKIVPLVKGFSTTNIISKSSDH